MEFGLLGPVVARHDGTTVPAGSGRERFVLATLLLNAGRLTTLDRLVDALWDDPPSTARAQLHNVISSVRRRLRAYDSAAGDDLIVTRATGYELHLGQHELDVLRFRELVTAGRHQLAAGDPAEAADLLAAALELWRGPALADVADELAEPIRQVLHEERLAAAEARLDAQFTLERYDDVLREVDPLLAEHPYRERLHELRMSALAESGRRAEALAVYRQLYRRLADDLGVEPGPPLRRIEQRILRGEGVADSGPPVPRQLPAATSVLTGRDKLIGEICAELTRDDHELVRVLVGPGGVGKTTLALAAAHRVAGSFADGQLYADLRGTHDPPADSHTVLGRLLRTLGVDGSRLPDDRDERVGMYRSLLARRRMLVVLDDAAGEEQVRPLLPTAAGSRALVTSRRQLGALVGAARWSVPVLAEDDAVALLAAVIGAERVAAEPATAVEVVTLCGNLPLAVCVAAARLAVHPEWTLDEFRRRLAQQWGRLDELAVGDLNVRASIELSYQALEEPLRRLLRRLGLVLATTWPAWVARELLCETDSGHVERMLDRLVEVHLIEPAGRDAVGQSRYGLHNLVRDFAVERAAAQEPGEQRAAAVSRMLSGWLALAGAADRRAGHYTTYSADLAEAADRAVPAARAARERPREWLETERSSLATAVEQAAAEGHAELAGELALRVSGFLTLRAYDDEREQALRVAAEALRAHGPEPLLLKVLQALYGVYAQLARAADMAAVATEALELARSVGDRTRFVRALLHAGLASRRLGRLDEAAGRFDEALAAEPDGTVLASLLVNRAETDRERGTPAPELVERALEIRRAGDNPRMTAQNLIIYAYTLIDAGRLDDAETALDEAARTTRTLGDDLHATYVEQTRADIDIRRGRWPAAAARLDQALPRFESLRNKDGTAEALRTRGELALCRGVPAEAVEPLRASLAIWRQLGSPLEQARLLARLARAHTALGETSEAATCREEYRAILRDLSLGETCLRLPPT